MSRTVYVNGEYVPETEAKVSIFDRAFLFGDGVYDVTSVIDGTLVEFEPHISRLHRSLQELEMEQPLTDDEIRAMFLELAERNAITEGLIYLQITRGVADRDFGYPDDAEQTIVAFTQEKNLSDDPKARRGVRIITIPDIRWQRRDIKSTALLAQTMGKQEAVKAGVDDAWMVEDGHVTEGTSNSAFIVTVDDLLVTRPLSNKILPSITRRAILTLAEQGEVIVEERAFTVDEAKSASEAFLTSASSFVMPVVEIDGTAIGDGKPGPVTSRLRELYLEEARRG